MGEKGRKDGRGGGKGGIEEGRWLEEIILVFVECLLCSVEVFTRVHVIVRIHVAVFL